MVESGYTLGFIGCGNLGTAVLASALRGVQAATQGVVPGRFIVCVKNEASKQRLHEQFGTRIKIADDNQSVLDESHVVILAFMPENLSEILGRLHFPHFTVLVSMLAGVTIENIRRHTTTNAFIARATLNTIARIGLGVTALSFQGEYLADSPITAAVEWLFATTGRIFVVEESQQNACVALCGSGPAFAYLFVESLVDGAVKMGLDYEVARQMAGQVLKGAGQMVLDGGHPAALRNHICVPGGTTINGICELETHGVRGAVIRAVETSTNVAKQLDQDGKGHHYESVSKGQSPVPSRTASTANLAEMAHQISLSRRNTRRATREWAP